MICVLLWPLYGTITSPLAKRIGLHWQLSSYNFRKLRYHQRTTWYFLAGEAILQWVSGHLYRAPESHPHFAREVSGQSWDDAGFPCQVGKRDSGLEPYDLAKFLRYIRTE
jgi:hypothetical protein